MGAPRYDKYRLTKKEFLLYGVQGVLYMSMLAFLFYRSLPAVLLFLPGTCLYLKRKKQKRMEENRELLNLQFKDGIQAVSAALQSGYSMENAIVQARRDMQLLHGADGLITREFAYMSGQLELNQTVEALLEDFARRSELEDIGNFLEVFLMAKRSGGDLVGIIKNAVDTIGEKVEVKREIKTVMAGRRMEHRIMTKIPFGIILYMNLASPGFLEVLYHNPAGILIMSCCLGVYLFSLYLGSRILEIEV